jgi:hypothetical protein
MKVNINNNNILNHELNFMIVEILKILSVQKFAWIEMMNYFKLIYYLSKI